MAILYHNVAICSYSFITWSYLPPISSSCCHAAIFPTVVWLYYPSSVPSSHHEGGHFIALSLKPPLSLLFYLKSHANYIPARVAYYSFFTSHVEDCQCTRDGWSRSAFEAHLSQSISPACRSNGFAHPFQLFHSLFSSSNVHRWALNQVKTLNRCRFNLI